MKKYTIFTDGAACNNNGAPNIPRASSGAAILLDSHFEELWSLTFLRPEETNQYGELKAAARAFEFFNKNNTEPCIIDFYSDSKYVIDGITQWIYGWKKNNWKNNTVAHRDLWERLFNASKNGLITKINFIHIRGHQNALKNEFPYKFNFRVDALATDRIEKWKRTL